MHTEFSVGQLRPGETFVVYQAPVLVPSWHQRLLSRLRVLLILVSFFGFLVALGPILLAEGQSRYFSFKYQESNLPKTSFFGQLLWLDKQQIISPADWGFSLIIPKIGVNARVLPQIDASDEAAYSEALKVGLAHAAGSSFPDQSGDVYIFGHSTRSLWEISRYNAIFYSLKDLEEGDEVILIFDQKRFVYQVSEKKVVEADDLSFLSSGGEGPRLVLQTCWPPGTTWKRFIVIAEPVGEVL